MQCSTFYFFWPMSIFLNGVFFLYLLPLSSLETYKVKIKHVSKTLSVDTFPKNRPVKRILTIHTSVETNVCTRNFRANERKQEFPFANQQQKIRKDKKKASSLLFNIHIHGYFLFIKACKGYAEYKYLEKE